MTFGSHWHRVTFAILHSKLLQAVFEIFLLRYEDAVALLTNLKTKEELQLTHHGHLILLLHHVPKLITILLVGEAEDYVIHIYLAHKQFTIIFFVKSVGSRDPGLKPLLFRKSLIVSYQARGACLRPYSALFSLYTMSGCFGSSKPGGCATYTSSSIFPLSKGFSHPFDTEGCYDDFHRLEVCE